MTSFDSISTTQIVRCVAYSIWLFIFIYSTASTVKLYFDLHQLLVIYTQRASIHWNGYLFVCIFYVCFIFFTFVQFSAWKTASKEKKMVFVSSHHIQLFRFIFIFFTRIIQSTLKWNGIEFSVARIESLRRFSAKPKSIWNNIRLSIIIFCYSKHAHSEIKIFAFARCSIEFIFIL